MRTEPHVAFVTDALLALGGAEKTLFTALECFPQADVFTLVYDARAFAGTPLKGRRVFTSYLSRLPLARSHHRLFLPLMPGAIERFDLRDYDVVVSFSYAVANAARAGAGRHLSYTYTPMRYAWRDLNIRGRRGGNNPLIRRYLHSFRRWDQAAAARITAFAAISENVAAQIRDDYGRQAQVIFPPVETERFHPQQRSGYYVLLSRLVAHKRVDLVVEAFRRLGLPLKIVGEGPEKERLMRAAGGNIEFLGFQPDAEVARLLGRARGFVCAAEEDFGIAIVEAQAAGCPVIAYAAGGALETIADGCTGLLFAEQSSEAIVAALQDFERRRSSFDSRAIADSARRFDKGNFKREFERFVMEAPEPQAAAALDAFGLALPAPR